MPRFQKVSPGDDLAIGAEDYNAMIDAAADYAARRGGDGFDATGNAGDRNTVLVQNNGNADCPIFGALGLDAPIFTPTDNLDEFRFSLSLSGSTPDKTKHYGKVAIALEPIAANDVGLCALAGLTIAQVNVTDANHTRCDIADGDNSALKSAVCGTAQILWKETGTGKKWAVIRLGAPLVMIVAKAGSDIPALSGSTPGSGTVTIWTRPSGNPAGAWSASSMTETGYNFSGAAMKAGKFLHFLEQDGALFGILESCT